MNVSKEAREAAATMLDDYRDRLTPDEQSDSVIVAINVRNGVCDDTIRVQAFAKFEAEITQRVRAEALEEAAEDIAHRVAPCTFPSTNGKWLAAKAAALIALKTVGQP